MMARAARSWPDDSETHNSDSSSQRYITYSGAITSSITAWPFGRAAIWDKITPMIKSLPWIAPPLLLAALCPAQVVVRVERPMPPPAWALAERALLQAYGDAAREFAAKYVDDRGFLRCVERWGGNDGPDDAMENFENWPLVYALGAPEVILDLYRKAWEGHLTQFTKARAPSIEMAREGMYYKEFVTSFDWEHT